MDKFSPNDNSKYGNNISPSAPKPSPGSSIGRDCSKKGSNSHPTKTGIITDDIKSYQNKLTKSTENETFIPENNEKIDTPSSQQANEERMEVINQSKKIDETGTATKPSYENEKKKRGPLLPLPLKDTKDQDKTRYFHSLASFEITPILAPTPFMFSNSKYITLENNS